MESLNVVDVSDDIRKEMKEGVTRILNIDVEIKGLQEEKKTIKKDMKENGVDVAVANKVLTLLKRYEKESQDQKMQMAMEIAEDFKEDMNISSAVYNLFLKEEK